MKTVYLNTEKRIPRITNIAIHRERLYDLLKGGSTTKVTITKSINYPKHKNPL